MLVLPILLCFFPGSMVLSKKRIHHPIGFLLQGFLISKQWCIFLCVVIPIFRVEDDHFCDKHCCQFYKHTDKHKNKTTVIRFVEYSRGFHNSDASIVLVQPIVWVMRVLFSSSNVSHHSGGPQSSSHSVTPFSKASTQPSAKYCHVGKDWGFV